MRPYRGSTRPPGIHPQAWPAMSKSARLDAIETYLAPLREREQADELAQVNTRAADALETPTMAPEREAARVGLDTRPDRGSGWLPYVITSKNLPKKILDGTQNKGLSKRATLNVKDKIEPEQYIPWETTIWGVDLGELDGNRWLQLDDNTFLPFYYRNRTMVVPADELAEAGHSRSAKDLPSAGIICPVRIVRREDSDNDPEQDTEPEDESNDDEHDTSDSEVHSMNTVEWLCTISLADLTNLPNRYDGTEEEQERLFQIISQETGNFNPCQIYGNYRSQEVERLISRDNELNMAYMTWNEFMWASGLRAITDDSVYNIVQTRRCDEVHTQLYRTWSILGHFVLSWVGNTYASLRQLTGYIMQLEARLKSVGRVVEHAEQTYRQARYVYEAIKSGKPFPHYDSYNAWSTPGRVGHFNQLIGGVKFNAVRQMPPDACVNAVPSCGFSCCGIVRGS